MQGRNAKHLEYIRDAAAFIRDIGSGRRQDDFDSDRVFRQAIERNFEIIGEAVNRLKREAPDTAARISNTNQIIAFRNVLAHGYDLVDSKRVWEAVTRDVPELLQEVEGLLREL